MSKPAVRSFLLLFLLLAVLCMVSLYAGAARIPFRDVSHILFMGGSGRESWDFIVLKSRLPQMLTALLSGAALSCSGLMLQTLFRNPLADPGILGISSGASLGVAIVILLLGGSVTLSQMTLTSSLSVLLAAFVGAMAVLLLILALSRIIRSALVLLVAGIMIGYLASSLISILNFMATADGLQSYIIWGLGNFTSVSMDMMPLYAVSILLGLLLSLMLVKPLNALCLGEDYARNLGFSVGRIRLMLLLVSGVLAAVTTAFCGPVTFIGLAVPHLSRRLLCSADHRYLLPHSMLLGSVLALVCSLLSALPIFPGGVLPLNALTPLLGAPVVLWVLLRGRVG